MMKTSASWVRKLELYRGLMSSPGDPNILSHTSFVRITDELDGVAHGPAVMTAPS